MDSYKKRLVWVGGLLAISLFLFALGYFAIAYELPSINKVTDYQPPLATQVFSSDLELIGEFYKQYRLLTPIDDIPPLVRKAFVAAEDSRFFEHGGIDYFGILRAVVKNIQAGGVKQGGSTITQQVAKSLLLSPEKTLLRKVREALLAFRIEKTLTKDEILYLYLNQIYLGHGAYGVAAGARVYFNKHLNQLNLAETAMLAGMPTAPGRDNPFVNPEKALQRRSYVLKMMQELNFISADERQVADKEALHLDDSSRTLNKTAAPYFTEQIRRYLVDKYGEDRLYEGGLKVYTTLSLAMQRSAEEAVKWNLHELDKRIGYRGVLKKNDESEVLQRLKEWQPVFAAAQEARKKTPPAPPLSDEAAYREPKLNAMVVEVENAKGRVKIITADDEGWIPLPLMSWARKPDPEVTVDEARLTQPSQALKRGDEILVRRALISEISKEKQKDFKDLNLFALEQEPDVQGALLAVNPENGFIMSMVGGYDFTKSEFNRAYQAKRQPGSAFKPIIYAAALDKGYTPATVILDAPMVFDDVINDKVWRPKNYTGTFQGEILFRTALIESRNVPTIKILQDIGIDYVLEYAKRLGIATELTRDNTLALGSSVVTPYDLTNAFMVLANGGVKKQQIFLKKILDRDGRELERYTNDDMTIDVTAQINEAKEELRQTKIEIIEPESTNAAPTAIIATNNAANNVNDNDNKPAAAANDDGGEKKLRILRPGQVISEETAFVATHLLNEVVTYGTGYKARALNRPAAGKTGTTDEHVDAWFVGYTPELLATTWVGFDEKKTLGRLETGAKAASPMWLKFMVEALEDRPKKAFRVPAGITFTRIDAETGKLANDKTTKAVLEAFKTGSEPKDGGKKAGTAKDFFLEE